MTLGAALWRSKKEMNESRSLRRNHPDQVQRLPRRTHEGNLVSGADWPRTQRPQGGRTRRRRARAFFRAETAGAVLEAPGSAEERFEQPEARKTSSQWRKGAKTRREIPLDTSAFVSQQCHGGKSLDTRWLMGRVCVGVELQLGRFDEGKVEEWRRPSCGAWSARLVWG